MGVWDFLTMPFDLPINPIFSYVGMAIIGAIAFILAYRITGEIGGSSGEMTIIHWVLRLVIFVILWALVCGIIYLVRFVRDYWVYVVIALCVLLFTLCGVFIYKHRNNRIRIKKDESDREKNEEKSS